MQVVKFVSDGGGLARSGLAGALELIAGGEAGALVAARLRDVARSPGELVVLLAWLEQAGADLIAADVGFDSRESGARSTVAVLREVERWDCDPHPARRPRGRPGALGRRPGARAAVGGDARTHAQSAGDRCGLERRAGAHAARRGGVEAVKCSARVGVPPPPPAGSRRTAGPSAASIQRASAQPRRRFCAAPCPAIAGVCSAPGRALMTGAIARVEILEGSWWSCPTATAAAPARSWLVLWTLTTSSRRD
jgi:hypothetical protein